MNNLRINKGFIMQTLDNKITIFDGDKSVLYSLNETASFIFKKLKNGYDKKKIADTLVKRYSIKHEKAEVDVTELIDDLIGQKIIEYAK